MNWNEKEAIRNNLLQNLADFMILHGEVKSDRQRSNYYCCVRIIELTWRGIPFTITEVDGMICRIDRE